MLNKYKWLLSLIFVSIMAIPIVLLVLPEKSETNTVDIIKKSSSTSGIFIIPPGEKEVNRDTTGRRVTYCNIGDKVAIWANYPKELFLIPETTPPIRIRGRGLSGRVSKLGEKNYLRFVNNGDEEVKIKARITSR